MKLILENSKGFRFSCLDDLGKAIPEGMSGKPLNYGQGEGQVEIDGTVWGFYVTEDGNYYMAYEEGVVGWSRIVKLVSAIVGALTFQYGIEISVVAEGPFTHESNV